jgi:hypothetical protein
MYISYDLRIQYVLAITAAVAHWLPCVFSETFILLRDIPCRPRNEEFIVRAYKGGTKKATHKSTLRYWNSYVAVKESFANFQSLFRNSTDDSPPEINAVAPIHSHAVSPIPTDHSKGNSPPPSALNTLVEHAIS